MQKILIYCLFFYYILYVLGIESIVMDMYICLTQCIDNLTCKDSQTPIQLCHAFKNGMKEIAIGTKHNYLLIKPRRALNVIYISISSLCSFSRTLFRFKNQLQQFAYIGQTCNITICF